MSSSSKPKAIVTCLYRRVPDFTFDMNYYLTSHIPTTTKLWTQYGLQKATVIELNSDSEYAINVIMEWKDTEGWDAAMKGDEVKTLVDDVKNFTNSEGLFLVGNIVG